MRIGLGLPSLTLGVTGSDIIDYARLAEDGGLDSLWVIDRIVFDGLEPISVLSAAAAVTSKVRLGTSVLLAATREPVMLAKQLATLDVLSQGRVVLGVGVGQRENDFQSTGWNYHTRGRRLEDNVNTMRRIWAGESPGDDIGPIGPKPVQKRIPILFGGASERAMTRGARLGDGYIGYMGYTRSQETHESFRKHWRSAGRTEKPMMMGLAYFYVDEDPQRAKEQARGFIARYYGARLGFDPADSAFLGPPQAIADGVLFYQSIGADEMILLPVVSDIAQAKAIIGPVRDLVAKASTH